MEGFTIRRTWMYHWLIAWLMCIDYLTGMTYKVILFLIPFLLVTKVKREWVLLLLVLRLLLLPLVAEDSVEATFEIHPIPFKNYQADLYLDGEKYLYYGKESLLEAEGTLSFTPFSKKRQELFSEYDHYVSRGYRSKVEIVEIRYSRETEEKLKNRILKHLYQKCEVFKEGQNLAFSLLFGSKDALLPEEKEELMEVGIMHLFVLSGLHYGIYERMIEALLKRAFVPKVIRTGITLVLFLFLNFLSGFHPSSLRFLLLFILRQWSFYTRREFDSWELFSLAALLILFIQPTHATGLSYILGIVAHGALLFFKRHRLLWLHVCLLPCQLIFHGTYSPIYLIYNFLLIMMMPLVLLSLWLGFIIRPLAILPELLLKTMDFGVTLLQGVNLYKLKLMMPTPFVYVLLILTALVSLYQYQNKPFYTLFRKCRFPFLLGIMVLLILSQVLGTRGLREGVHFLNVYQGDACLIFSEDGQTILIDTGNEDIIFDHLRKLGVYEIDHLFITHLDDDHSKFMDEIPSKLRYTTPFSPITEARVLRKGNSLRIGDVSIEVLSPERDMGNHNDNSLVLRVIKDGRTFLFAGDVSGKNHQVSWNEGVDILKFSHHGSIHSLDPLRMHSLKPQVTVLSYGRNNFGHPSPEVIEFFSEGYIHHTFLHGNLQITEKGYRLY